MNREQVEGKGLTKPLVSWGDGGPVHTTQELLDGIKGLGTFVRQVATEEPTYAEEPAPRYKYLSEVQIRQIEENHRDGLTADQIVDICRKAGMRFSKPTLRLYVSKGILQKSDRTAKKVGGKRYTSQGLYPVANVRKIAHVKYLLEEEEHTVQEIADCEIDELFRASDSVRQVCLSLFERRQSTARRAKRGLPEMLDSQVTLRRVLDREIQLWKSAFSG